jgi:hypothetical protein
MELEILPRDFAEILCIYVVWWENGIALGPGPGKLRYTEAERSSVPGTFTESISGSVFLTNADKLIFLGTSNDFPVKTHRA